MSWKVPRQNYDKMEEREEDREGKLFILFKWSFSFFYKDLVPQLVVINKKEKQQYNVWLHTRVAQPITVEYCVGGKECPFRPISLGILWPVIDASIF